MSKHLPDTYLLICFRYCLTFVVQTPPRHLPDTSLWICFRCCLTLFPEPRQRRPDTSQTPPRHLPGFRFLPQRINWKPLHFVRVKGLPFFTATPYTSRMAPLSSRNPVHLENGSPLEPRPRTRLERLHSRAASPYTSRIAPLSSRNPVHLWNGSTLEPQSHTPRE